MMIRKLKHFADSILLNKYWINVTKSLKECFVNVFFSALPILVATIVVLQMDNNIDEWFAGVMVAIEGGVLFVYSTTILAPAGWNLFIPPAKYIDKYKESYILIFVICLFFSTLVVSITGFAVLRSGADMDLNFVEQGSIVCLLLAILVYFASIYMQWKDLPDGLKLRRSSVDNYSEEYSGHRTDIDEANNENDK